MQQVDIFSHETSWMNEESKKGKRKHAPMHEQMSRLSAGQRHAKSAGPREFMETEKMPGNQGDSAIVKQSSGGQISILRQKKKGRNKGGLHLSNLSRIEEQKTTEESVEKYQIFE